MRYLKQLIKNINRPVEPIRIVEIGCGGGDNLRVIQCWAQKRDLKVSLKGIDINRECISFAESRMENKDIQFICSDYKDVSFSPRPDIIFSSLFCHHFTNGELIKMLQWMKVNSGTGFFINDLHRHPVAYYSIKILTRLFSESFLVKNDAPLSVKRGFRKEDWTRLFAAAGISDFSCQWKWAFRWLITCNHATATEI